MSTDKPSTATDIPKPLTDKQRFIGKLREETNYPTLRNLYLTFYLIFSSLYWFALLFGALLIYSEGGLKGFGIVFCAVLLLVFNKALYELSILVIDIADSVNHSSYVNHATYLLASKRSKDA
jgi:hypothetical protein